MGERRVFAIDLGASGGKCFVGTFKANSFSMEEVHRFSHDCVSFYIKDRENVTTERSYWDDIYLYNQIVKGLQNFRREIADSLDSIGIDTWGSDGGFLTPDGDILGKIYSYRDHRLNNMIEKVKKRISPLRIYEITGIHFQPFNVSNQLLWFIENRKDLFSPDLRFLPMPTIFNFYLGGCKKIDSTWASVTQLMDCHTKKWSEEILMKLGIPFEIMPEIVQPGTITGKMQKPLADSLKINQPRLVAVGSHDTASAYAAAPLKNPDDALIISSGTWSLVGKLIPRPITSREAMKYNLSNEGGIGKIRFLKNCMGLWIPQQLRRQWQVEEGIEIPWDSLVRIVKKAPPFFAFIDPDAPCFYNPKNMQDAIFSFLKKTNQKLPNHQDRGTILRLVYESLAMKYRLVNEQIKRASGMKTNVIHIISGGCKNEVLNQFTADATSLGVIAGPEEATAIGNMMIQAVGLGIIEGLDKAASIIRETCSIREYRALNSADWQKHYERFKKIIKNRIY